MRGTATEIPFGAVGFLPRAMLRAAIAQQFLAFKPVYQASAPIAGRRLSFPASAG